MYQIPNSAYSFYFPYQNMSNWAQANVNIYLQKASGTNCIRWAVQWRAVSKVKWKKWRKDWTPWLPRCKRTKMKVSSRTHLKLNCYFCMKTRFETEAKGNSGMACQICRKKLEGFNHPVKNTIVLFIIVSVFTFFDQIWVANPRQTVSMNDNDWGAVIETRCSIGCHPLTFFPWNTLIKVVNVCNHQDYIEMTLTRWEVESVTSWTLWQYQYKKRRMKVSC